MQQARHRLGSAYPNYFINIGEGTAHPHGAVAAGMQFTEVEGDVGRGSPDADDLLLAERRGRGWRGRGHGSNPAMDEDVLGMTLRT